jgi:glycosyltransferase involved in cell wall biosynthesis
MRILAQEIIVYTKTQEKELKKKMPSKKIVTAANAVFFKEEILFDNSKKNDIINLIYVGRLTELKKPFLLVKAFADSLEFIPSKANLIIVGEGDEKNKIINFIKKYKFENKVQILGHVSDYHVLKELYSKSLFSVSPGYVGLSAVQSFCFGVPMLISKNENHSPEIEAVEESENSLFFETNNIKDFSSKILEVYSNKNHWLEKRSMISQDCKDNYSIEEMAKKFIEISG